MNSGSTSETHSVNTYIEEVLGFRTYRRQSGSVRWAARCSGGLKSLWRSNEGRHIQKRGVIASLAGGSRRYGDV